MRVTKDFDYWINDRVVINAIDQPGKIIGIIIEGLNVVYDVQYWWEGKINEVKLDADDIHDLKGDTHGK